MLTTALTCAIVQAAAVLLCVANAQVYNASFAPYTVNKELKLVRPTDTHSPVCGKRYMPGPAFSASLPLCLPAGGPSVRLCSPELHPGHRAV